MFPTQYSRPHILQIELGALSGINWGKNLPGIAQPQRNRPLNRRVNSAITAGPIHVKPFLLRLPACMTLQSLWKIKSEKLNFELTALNRERQELEKASGSTAQNKAKLGTDWSPNLGRQDTQSCWEVLGQQVEAPLVPAGVTPFDPCGVAAFHPHLPCDTHSAQTENTCSKFLKTM